MIKLTKTTILPNCQVPNHSFFEGTRGNIFYIFWAKDFCLWTLFVKIWTVSNFFMIKLTVIPKKKPFDTWQFGKIGVLVNFIIQKLKSKHLVCLSFLWWQVFLREREKIFNTYSGPKSIVTVKEKIDFWSFFHSKIEK